MMHFYFDTLDEETSNLDYLSTTPKTDFYLTSNGTVIKQTLRKMKRPVSELVNCEHTPGIYYIDVNGDPCWWTGLSSVHNGPTDIFTNLPEHIVDYVKRGKLRLVIGADKEGGPFQHKALGDGFAAITKSARIVIFAWQYLLNGTPAHTRKALKPLKALAEFKKIDRN